MSAEPHQVEERADALLRMKEEAASDERPQPGALKKLRPSEVCIEEKVFQQRSLEGGLDGSEAHIRNLMDAIRDAPGHQIEPIEVWWTGQRWVVIDGHHRLKAYNRLQGDAKAKMKAIRVPIRVFAGTLTRAIARAAEGNSKDKMPMSKEEKSDAAWRMVCLGGMSKAEIVAASSRADATVGRMRRTRETILKKIEAGDEEDLTKEQMVNLSWDYAQMLERGGRLPEKNDDWVEQQAREWARRLGRHFKGRLPERPLCMGDDDRGRRFPVF